ncbi:MAG TPA: hypothetical protein VMZ52_02005 [Bryobacteraceae bacterium]|nr:hypothetical protein [Bryobacteraceae bacterium]
MKRITKISLFAIGLVVLVGLTGIVPGFPSLAPAVQADTEETLTLDVAIDCRTFNFNRGISEDQFVRGDSFIANGTIFRGGTLLPGAQSNDPNASGSIGDFIEHGTMAATLAEIIAGKRPAFVANWLHLLKDGRGLVADGPHPDSGPMAVVGGMGGFSGASGEVIVEIIGTNNTGCPNVRSTFHLKKQAPK